MALQEAEDRLACRNKQAFRRTGGCAERMERGF